MDAALRERDQTAAGRPIEAKARNPLFYGYRPAFYGGSFELSFVVVSTSPDYDALICFGGTAADPVCRVLLPNDYPSKTSADNVLEIRFLSGLTWAEVGELFGVSRRSVHNWANGETLKPENVILIREALRAIRTLHRLSSAETRIALLAPLPTGRRGLDLLRARLWPEAIAAVKALPAFPVPDSPHPDRALQHPTAYFGARGDSPGPTSGRLVRSRRMRQLTP